MYELLCSGSSPDAQLLSAVYHCVDPGEGNDAAFDIGGAFGSSAAGHRLETCPSRAQLRVTGPAGAARDARRCVLISLQQAEPETA